MSRMQVIFTASFIWLFLSIGVMVGWGLRPMFALGGCETMQDVQRRYPIRLASLTTSPLQQHTLQLDAEDARKAVPFDAEDWAVREVRARCCLVYVSFFASGLVVNWILWGIVSGRQTWDMK